MKGVLAITLAFCAACAAVYRPPAGNTAYGPHRFKQVLQNPQVTLEGTLVILPDTVTMTLGNVPCLADRPSRRTESAFTFDCGEHRFWFSRSNPLRDNGYRVPTIQWQTRRVCAATRVNPTTKAETCASYMEERVAKQVVLEGPVIFIAR